MTETDAFARLKTRPRATVPARTSSLIEPNNDKKTEISHSSKATVSHSLMTEVSEGQLDRVPDLDVSESSGMTTIRAKMYHDWLKTFVQPHFQRSIVQKVVNRFTVGEFPVQYLG
jgi:hypothetical protein